MAIYLYSRVSTSEQAASGLGLAAQRRLLEGEADRRGWQDHDVQVVVTRRVRVEWVPACAPKASCRRRTSPPVDQRSLAGVRRPRPGAELILDAGGDAQTGDHDGEFTPGDQGRTGAQPPRLGDPGSPGGPPAGTHLGQRGQAGEQGRLPAAMTMARVSLHLARESARGRHESHPGRTSSTGTTTVHGSRLGTHRW